MDKFSPSKEIFCRASFLFFFSAYMSYYNFLDDIFDADMLVRDFESEAYDDNDDADNYASDNSGYHMRD